MAWTWSLPPDVEEHAGHLMLTDTEMCLLAKFEFMQDQEGCPTIQEVCRVPNGGMWDQDPRQMEAYLSLSRMGYIREAKPREVRHASVVDILSDNARQRLLSMSARTYKCCSYAIRLPCVCMERTYCPNPEHSGGCHGTHD